MIILNLEFMSWLYIEDEVMLVSCLELSISIAFNLWIWFHMHNTNLVYVVAFRFVERLLVVFIIFQLVSFSRFESVHMFICYSCFWTFGVETYILPFWGFLSSFGICGNLLLFFCRITSLY